MGSEQWYKQRGVPYRRGYLLYGPPGTGKTSFIQALCCELKLNICMLNIGSPDMNENSLMQSFQNTPNNTIILIEDIDSIFVKRDLTNDSKQSKISFSGLLNALDGVRTKENLILFMTTNFVDKLDPALLRPGRADFHMELKNASISQIQNLYLKFYPGQEEAAKQMAALVPEFKISMAKLQEHFIKFEADAAIRNYKILTDEFEDK